MTQEEEQRLGIALVGAVIILGAIAFWPKKKPKKKPVDHGVKVGPLCNEYTVTDETKLRLAQETTWVEWLSKGVKDPWILTSAVVQKIAPVCKVPTQKRLPHELRSPGEAIFYFNAFTDTLCYLIDRNVLNPEQAIAESRAAQAWAINQGVDPEHPALADPACATNP
jgi:hypothetical protein